MKTNRCGHALFLCSVLSVSGGALAASPEKAGPAEHDPRLDVLKEVQQRFTAAFVKAAGFGFDRLPRDSHTPTPFKPELFTFVLDGKVQHVQSVNLIGVVRHPGMPVVFTDSSVGFADAVERKRPERLSNAKEPAQTADASEAAAPAMSAAKSSKTRAPDYFEATALMKLEQGEEVVASFDGDEIRVVGAIRASNDCMGCHTTYRSVPRFQHLAAKSLKDGAEVRNGDVLGAFTYRIKAVTPSPTKEPLVVAGATGK